MTRVLVLVGILSLLPPAVAQESGSYKLAEHVFNAGGHPAGGTILSSTSYRVTLDAVGDAVVGTGSSSDSYITDAGFGSAYPPPGEVAGLRFIDGINLQWDAERSVGVYNVYRGLASDLGGQGFGSCWRQDLPTTTTTDGDPVPVSDGFFYLVTARNRVGEEGIRGFESDGTAREGAVCP